MNSSTNSTYAEHWHLNPFSKPRTTPGKWDLSEMLAGEPVSPQPMADGPARGEAAETGPQADPAPDFDPFPLPNTMPSGWDLSGTV